MALIMGNCQKQETKPSVYSKERGLTISLIQAGAYVQYTRDGLYKLFNNPNDIEHKKFNILIDRAQLLYEKEMACT